MYGAPTKKKRWRDKLAATRHGRRWRGCQQDEVGCWAEARRDVNSFAIPEEEGATSGKMEGQGLQQGFGAVPGDLDTDANQEERGQLGDNGPARCSKDSRQAVGKCIAEQNADGDQHQSNESS